MPPCTALLPVLASASAVPARTRCTQRHFIVHAVTWCAPRLYALTESHACTCPDGCDGARAPIGWRASPGHAPLLCAQPASLGSLQVGKQRQAQANAAALSCAQALRVCGLGSTHAAASEGLVVPSGCRRVIQAGRRVEPRRDLSDRRVAPTHAGACRQVANHLGTRPA